MDRKLYAKLVRYVAYAIPASRKTSDLPLLEFFTSLHPKFNERNCTFEQVMHHCPRFKKAQEISAAATRLFKLTENFIVSEAAVKDEIFRSASLSSYYLQNKLQAHYVQHKKIYDAESIEERMQTEAFHLMQFSRLTDEMRFYSDVRLHKYPLQRLQVARWSLEQFYQISRLRFDLGHITRLMVAEDWHRDFQEVSKVEFRGDGILIKIYRKLMDGFEGTGSLDLDGVLKLLEQHWDDIPTEHLSEISSVIKGYCVASINKGKLEFIEPFLLINQKLDAANLLVRQDSMDVSVFRNIIYAAVFKKQFDFATHVVDWYGKYLPEQSREIVVTISRANIAFEKEHYEEASALLAKINPSSFADTFHWRKMSIKSAFKLGDYELLDLHLTAWRRWETAMKKAAPERLQDTRNFALYLSEIVKMKVRQETVYAANEDWKSLKKRIEKDATVIERDWLLSVCDQFINK